MTTNPDMSSAFSAQAMERRDPATGRYLPTTLSTEDRFWSKVNRTEHCWTWRRGLTGTGYGAFYPTSGHQVGAHVWAWESVNGAVPDELVLDHLCENRACVRPDHLEPTTRGDNVLRSTISMAGRNQRKTHCLRGHPLSGDNLRVTQNARNPERPPYRACRTCLNASRREKRRQSRGT